MGSSSIFCCRPVDRPRASRLRREAAEPALTAGMVAPRLPGSAPRAAASSSHPTAGRGQLRHQLCTVTEPDTLGERCSAAGRAEHHAGVVRVEVRRRDVGDHDAARGRHPDLEATHDDLSKGRVLPSVDTTYTATYRVGDGAGSRCREVSPSRHRCHCRSSPRVPAAWLTKLSAGLRGVAPRARSGAAAGGEGRPAAAASPAPTAHATTAEGSGGMVLHGFHASQGRRQRSI